MAANGNFPNQNGPDCPACNFPTHRAELDGEVRFRCTTDHCERGWMESEEVSE